MGMLPSGIKQPPSLPAGDKRPARGCSSMEKPRRVQGGKQSVVEDTKIRRADDRNKEDCSGDDCIDPPCQLMVRTGIASSKETATKILGGNSMLKKKNYIEQVAMGPSNCPWKIAYAVTDTEAGSDIIKMDAMNLL